jgi:chorismate synthase
MALQDYSEMAKAYRPSHADATYDFKYGVRAVQVPFTITSSNYT